MPPFDLKTEIGKVEANLNQLRDDMLSWSHEYPEYVDAALYVERLAARLREPVLDSGAALFLESAIEQADSVRDIMTKKIETDGIPEFQEVAADVESEAARLRGLLIVLREGA